MPQFPCKLKDFIQHNTNTSILETEVCMLGKIGAIVIIITLLHSYQQKYKKFYTFLYATIFILSFIMNRPLFIRSLPFYVIQFI